MRHFVAIIAALTLAALKLHASVQSYEQCFSDLLAKGTHGFVSDTRLVDTNNPGPLFGGRPLRFSQFSKAGELAGIKLGMTMSEVVAAWGKPRALFTRCIVGPRFSYGRGGFLFFRENRLVLMTLGEGLLAGSVFDNGLKLGMQRAEVEALLGPPAPRRADPADPWQGDIMYVSDAVRTILTFHDAPRTPTSAWQVEKLSGVAMGLDKELGRKRPGEQGAAPNAAPRHR